MTMTTTTSLPTIDAPASGNSGGNGHPDGAIIEEIKRAIDFMAGDANVIEIRVPEVPGRGKPYLASGYFDRQHRQQAALAAYQYSYLKKAPGVYMVLNPCDPSLLARCPNMMKDYAKQSTADQEVTGRKWLFGDIDPSRCSGIPATDEEKQAAANVGEHLAYRLRGYGFGHPVFQDSGNGEYLFYRVDLPNDDATTELIRKFYLGLETLVVPKEPGKPHAHIDTGVYNAARIARIGGTWNRKGGGTADRPHRLAHLEEPAEDDLLTIVPREAIEAVAALTPEPAHQPTRQTTAGSNSHAPPRLDVARWLADRHVEYRTKDRPGGRGYLVTCPFGPHGGNGESAVWQADSGLLTYECKHSSCVDRRWEHYRDAIGKPDAYHYDRPVGQTTSKPKVRNPIPKDTVVMATDRNPPNYGHVVEDHGDTVVVHFDGQEGHPDVPLPRSQLRRQDGTSLDGEPSKPLPAIRDAYELCQNDIPLPAELIAELLHQASKLSIGGASKGFKTWTLDYLCLAVAYGLDFLGLQTQQSKVLLIDLELQEAFSRRRLITLEHARGIQREPGRLDVWHLRGYATSYREIFPRVIERIRGGNYGLLVLDPIYKLYGSDTDENSARDVAALMNAIEALAVETGAAVAFGSHFSKGNQAGKDVIDRVSGSGVFARDPDSLVNLTAHEQPDCYTVNATLRNFPPMEPFVVRWEFPLFVREDGLDPAALKPVRQANRQRSEAQQHEKLQSVQQRILGVAAMFSRGETATILRDTAGLKDPEFKPALALLIESGDLLPAEIQKSNRKKPYPGYILSSYMDSTHE